MRNLMLAVLAVAGLGAGAALAQGDAESQAGSAWRAPPDTAYGPIPGTSEYYGNSGWPPADQRAYDNRSRRYVPYANRAAPAYPYVQPSRRDRDGDGVRDRRDRYPDDPRRW